jgi:ubiquinone/menaquinone biosynthesis C-methylase UbiE
MKRLRKRISFDCAAQIYDKTRGLPKHVRDKLVRSLITQLRNYGTILDAGVGTGRLAKPLQDNGFELIGADISTRMLRKAVDRGVDSLFKSDVCFLPFKADSFDATVCVHLLHLVSEWKLALWEICRVTRKALVTTVYANKNPIQQAYSSLLKDYGYASRRSGKGEWELRALVEPSRSVFVASYEISADERLSHLRQRAYSSQWSVPENVNERVVDELKGIFGGKTVSQELHVLSWRIDELKAYCTREPMS